MKFEPRKMSRAAMETWIARYDEIPDVGPLITAQPHHAPERNLSIKCPVGAPPEELNETVPEAFYPKIQTHSGYQVGIVKGVVGNYSGMHGHAYEETFLAIGGRWRVIWQSPTGWESAVIGPLDVLSVPENVFHDFQCIEPEAGKDHGTMGVITSAGSDLAIHFATLEQQQELVDAGFISRTDFAPSVTIE